MKVSKYGVISRPYFPVFWLNTVKYGPEITPYLDTINAVCEKRNCGKVVSQWSNEVWEWIQNRFFVEHLWMTAYACFFTRYWAFQGLGQIQFFEDFS